MSDFFKLLFILFCSCAASAQMVLLPRTPRVPYRLPANFQPRRQVSIPLKPMVPYRLNPAATAQLGTQQGTSLAGLRRRLLERLAINRQFQQIASAPPAPPSQDIAPQSGISNMLDSILTMRSQRGPSISSSKPNTQVMTRSAAIQNLQRRFGGHSSSFSSDGFQNQMKDSSVFGSMFKPRTTPAAPPKPNIQLSISRSASSRSLMDQSPSSFLSSASGFPRSSSSLDTTSTNLISSRPSFQSSSTSTLSSPSRTVSPSSSLGSVLSASNAINSAAAARGQLSDLLDSRMDLMSDMMEAGMGFGGGMNLGMGNMFGSGFGGGAGAGMFGGFGGLSFL